MNLIPHRPNFIQGTALRVWEWPIIAPQTRNVRALFAASRGDQEARSLCELLRQLLRLSMAQVDANFPHDLKNFRVHPRSWFYSGETALALA